MIEKSRQSRRDRNNRRRHFLILKSLRESLSIASYVMTRLSIFAPLFKFYYLRSLQQELDLSRNQLAGFEEDFAVKLLNIDDVKFEQNPIVCDLCHVGPILNRLSMVIHFSHLPEITRINN